MYTDKNTQQSSQITLALKGNCGIENGKKKLLKSDAHIFQISRRGFMAEFQHQELSTNTEFSAKMNP